MNEKENLIVEVKYKDLILLKTDIRYLIINHLYLNPNFPFKAPINTLEAFLNGKKFNLNYYGEINYDT